MNDQIQGNQGAASNVSAGIKSIDHAEVDHVPTNAEKLQRAIENGYQPEGEMSGGDRAHALITLLEHALAHNSPITQAMIAEARALLNVPQRDDMPEEPAET